MFREAMSLVLLACAASGTSGCVESGSGGTYHSGGTYGSGAPGSGGTEAAGPGGGSLWSPKADGKFMTVTSSGWTYSSTSASPSYGTGRLLPPPDPVPLKGSLGRGPNPQDVMKTIAADPGQCWSAYGSDGNYDITQAMILQADGKILQVGRSYIASRASGNVFPHLFSLMRFDPDGKVDAGFGFNGRLGIEFVTDGSGMASSVAQQADGKIMVAGVESFDPSDPWSALSSYGVFARLNPDGSLDTSFGHGGLLIEPRSLLIAQVLVQADGRILALGETWIKRWTGWYNVFELFRYNSDGTPDVSFGPSQDGSFIDPGIPGNSVTHNGFGNNYAMALQPDGKIVVVRIVDNFDGDSLIALARYNADGSRDTAFGPNGVIRSPSTELAAGVDVKIQADGKIVYLFPHLDPASQFSDIGLRRFNPDGSVDGSFGQGGEVITSFYPTCQGDAMPHAMALQADGKIVVGGAHIVRYNTDGSLDPGFGAGGQVYADSGCMDGYAILAWALAIQPSNGKIVFSGTYGSVPLVGGTSLSQPYDTFASGRLNPDGSVDYDFGELGRAIDAYVPNGKRAFVTAETYAGNLGGLSGADAICTADAAAAGLGGQWKAYLWSNDEAGQDVSRIRDAGPWYRVDRTVPVLDLAGASSLRDAAIDNAINTTEYGVRLAGENPNVYSPYYGPQLLWIGTGCGDWASSSVLVPGQSSLQVGGIGDYGSARYWDQLPTYLGTSRPCDSALPMYCFEQ